MAVHSERFGERKGEGNGREGGGAGGGGQVRKGRKREAPRVGED